MELFRNHSHFPSEATEVQSRLEPHSAVFSNLTVYLSHLGTFSKRTPWKIGILKWVQEHVFLIGPQAIIMPLVRGLTRFGELQIKLSLSV